MPTPAVLAGEDTPCELAPSESQPPFSSGSTGYHIVTVAGTGKRLASALRA